MPNNDNPHLDQPQPDQQEPQHNDPTPEEDTTPDTGDSRLKSARAEAAKFRTRLREVEAERDELAQRYEQLATSVIAETATARHKVTREALFDSGADWKTMLDDNGAINLQAVDEAAHQAIARYGKPQAGPEDPNQGRFGATTPHSDWASALRP